MGVNPPEARPMPNPEPETLDEIRAANQRFYDAFNTLDIAQMEAIWETSPRALCVHPGWSPIIGWPDIRQSWQRIFDHANLMQFSIRTLNIILQNDLACLTCIESVTSVVQGRAANFAACATNIFARHPDGWKIIAHHASPGA